MANKQSKVEIKNTDNVGVFSITVYFQGRHYFGYWCDKSYLNTIKNCIDNALKNNSEYFKITSPSNNGYVMVEKEEDVFNISMIFNGVKWGCYCFDEITLKIIKNTISLFLLRKKRG